MKAIINGKKYDTSTAKLIAQNDNGRYGSFSYCREELYQKKNGEFFIYGEGGPMTEYAKPSGENCWVSGSAITPMKIDMVKKWAEKNMDVDKYEELFGEVEE